MRHTIRHSRKLRCADRRHVGTVRNVVAHAGFFRGRLELDICDDRPVFEAVVSLATAVDTASPADYRRLS